MFPRGYMDLSVETLRIEVRIESAPTDAIPHEPLAYEVVSVMTEDGASLSDEEACALYGLTDDEWTELVEHEVAQEWIAHQRRRA